MAHHHTSGKPRAVVCVLLWVGDKVHTHSCVCTAVSMGDCEPSREGLGELKTESVTHQRIKLALMSTVEKRLDVQVYIILCLFAFSSRGMQHSMHL